MRNTNTIQLFVYLNEIFLHTAIVKIKNTNPIEANLQNLPNVLFQLSGSAKKKKYIILKIFEYFSYKSVA